MGEFFFVARALLLSLLILLALQFRVGGESLEERATQWVRSSSLAGEMRSLGDSAVKMVERAWVQAKDTVSKDIEKKAEALRPAKDSAEK